MRDKIELCATKDLKPAKVRGIEVCIKHHKVILDIYSQI